MTIMTSSGDRPRNQSIRRVSTAEAKAKLSELVGAVAFRGDRVVIERRGRPVAALISLEDAERLDEPRKPVRPRGALALVGAWSDVEDVVIDDLIKEIYESRARDIGRAVDLSR